MTWIEVVDTAIKILGGTLIGGLLTWLHEKSRFSQELRKARAERYNQHIVDPITKFVDDFLRFMSDLYWSSVDGSDKDWADTLDRLRKREAAVGARIRSLGSAELTAAFSEMENCLGALQLKVHQKKAITARDDVTKATELAAKVLRTLLPSPEKS